MTGSRRRGLTLAFIAVFLWSFTIPMTRVAVGGFDPLFTASGRAVIAGLLATVVLIVRRVPVPPRRLWRPIAITMIGAVFGWPILISLALVHTSSGHAAVIASFMPMMTAIFAVMFTHERVSVGFWAAVGLGTGALIFFSISRTGLEGGGLVGDLLIVGAVILSSMCYVQGAAVTREMPGWQVISWVVVMAMPITVPASVLLWWATKDSYSPNLVQWGSLIFLGVIAMYLGFFAWYQGLHLAGVARGGQVQQLQALLTLLWSALLLGEQVSLLTVATALVVVLAVAWAQSSRSRAQVPPVIR